MLITRKPQSQQNIYTNQHNQKEPATKPRNVRQDKGFLTQALAASLQPGPVARGSRADAAKTRRAHPTPRGSARGKLIHTTLWLDPVVRAEFERIAAREQLSISQVGAAACADWVRSDIHRQQGALAELTQRQMIREELQAFGGRIVFFLMRIAFSAEQTRILVTNVLKLVLKLTGHDQKDYYTSVDESAKLAKRNILRKTPQLKSLIEEWEASNLDGRRGEESV